MSAVVRCYTAYDIHNKTFVASPASRLFSPADLVLLRRLYDMTLFSFLIAFGHFGSEVLIYRSAKLTGPVLSPILVSSESPFDPLSIPRAHDACPAPRVASIPTQTRASP